jgi:predicted transcriptional regulator
MKRYEAEYLWCEIMPELKMDNFIAKTKIENLKRKLSLLFFWNFSKRRYIKAEIEKLKTQVAEIDEKYNRLHKRCLEEPITDEK